MKAYLDNGATTQISVEVVEAMQKMYSDLYGNPSSMHKMGVEVEKLVKSARKVIAKAIKASPEEIYFTSGGTEANNLAIQGYLKASRKKHIITTAIEHPSVHSLFKSFEQSHDVTYLSVDQNGYIKLDELKSVLREDTALVSIMLVNNEIGTIQNIQEISKLLKNTETILHVDAVQALGKVECHVKKQGIDMMTISGHKIHGPKGIGALYIKKGVTIKPLFIGGGQEKMIRPGTENIPGIIGFSKAVEKAMDGYDENQKHLNLIRTRFITGLEDIKKMKLNSPKEGALHIVNVSFPGMRGEVLLHTLESNDVYVSTGSACASKNKSYSHVLEAIGLDDVHKEGAIRFSFSKYTSVEMIDYALKILKESIIDLDQIIKGK